MSKTRRVARRILSSAAVAALWVLGAGFGSPAAAQVNDGEWELGFAVGSANIDSSSEEFDLDFRREVRGSYRFTDFFELEAQVLRADAPLDAALTAVMVNGVFNFNPDGKVVPYAMAGVGHYWLEDISIFGSDTELDDSAYQAALGTRIYVRAERKMAVRLEASSLWTETGLFDRERHLSLAAGFTWKFGGS